MSFRATRRQRASIDRAAAALGKSRSAFILEAACREAESILLDRRHFQVDEKAFRAIAALLDAPPAAISLELRRLLSGEAPWDRPSRA